MAVAVPLMQVAPIQTRASVGSSSVALLMVGLRRSRAPMWMVTPGHQEPS